MTTKETEHLLREIADPAGTLPEVRLELSSHEFDKDIFAAYSDRARIGEIKLGAINKDEPFVIQGTEIDRELRGHGFGFAMYLGAAALAYDEGHQLTSDIMVSRDAAALWARLQNRGLARIW